MFEKLRHTVTLAIFSRVKRLFYGVTDCDGVRHSVTLLPVL
jgi:hypothetical protein